VSRFKLAELSATTARGVRVVRLSKIADLLDEAGTALARAASGQLEPGEATRLGAQAVDAAAVLRHARGAGAE
jgi:hypothetical protein